MISFRGFDRTEYKLRLTRHALIRAAERDIDLEEINRTIWCGRIERYGKHGVKFIQEGKERIICVGEVIGDAIKIFTVER